MAAIRKLHERFNEAGGEDEVVVMRLDTGDFYSLSGTASEVWQLIDGEKDRAALIAQMCERFDHDPLQVAAELDRYLDQLKGLGLLAAD